jgi:hypothetical protein
VTPPDGFVPDPKCIVCKGDGVLLDSAGRQENCACRGVPRRDPYAQPSEGWVGDALAGVLADAERRAAATEEHRRACNAAPCLRCDRRLCGCGDVVIGATRCDTCRMLHRAIKALEPVRASIPKRFRWAYEDHDAIRQRVKASPELIARALANPPSTDMVLFGDTAMGKTSLVVGMLDAWVQQDPEARKGARFVEAYGLAGARARHPLGQGEAPEVIAAMDATLLVIDDLGSEIDDRRNVLADVIFHRHNEELPTWVTTGFTAEQLMARYGSAVVRRMLEQGKRVELGGKR